MNDETERQIPTALRLECQDSLKEGIDPVVYYEERRKIATGLLDKWKAVLDQPMTPLSSAKLLYTPNPLEAKIKTP